MDRRGFGVTTVGMIVIVPCAECGVVGEKFSD